MSRTQITPWHKRIINGAFDSGEPLWPTGASAALAARDAEIAELRKALDGWQDVAAEQRVSLDQANRNIDLRALHQANDVWYWQGDGTDHPESISNSMCIVMRGDHLRALVGARESVQPVGVLGYAIFRHGKQQGVEMSKTMADRWVDAQCLPLVAAKTIATPRADAPIGIDLDGMPQPYAGAIVLLETIAQCGALAFFADGSATPNHELCLRFAGELREAGRASAPRADTQQYSADMKSMILGQAVCHWKLRWPADRTSNVMVFNGQCITRAEFETRAAAATAANRGWPHETK
jgi:hypothetical protein